MKRKSILKMASWSMAIGLSCVAASFSGNILKADSSFATDEAIAIARIILYTGVLLVSASVSCFFWASIKVKK